MAKKFKVKKDVFTSTKPNYYKVSKDKDLFDIFKKYLLTAEEYRGFLKANLYKYTYRANKKGQLEADRNKAVIYAKELRDFDTKQKGSK